MNMSNGDIVDLRVELISQGPQNVEVRFSDGTQLYVPRRDVVNVMTRRFFVGDMVIFSCVRGYRIIAIVDDKAWLKREDEYKTANLTALRYDKQF